MKKWWWLVVIIVAGVIAFVIVHIYKKGHQTAPKASPVPVTLSAVTVKTLPLTYKTTGTLLASAQTTITTKAPGYVVAIYFHEGDFIKSGQKLVQLDDTAERSALGSAQSAAALSQLNYERNLKLYKQHYVAPQALAGLKDAKKEAAATVKASLDKLANKTLRAPFSGFVGARTISPGDYIAPGTAVATLVDTLHLKISYTVPASYMPQLKLNQKITISSADSPGDAQATISYISPTIDAGSQTLSLHAIMDNSAKQFKPGQLVSVTQPVGLIKNALLIPQISVIYSLGGNKVFVVKNGKAQSVKVTLGKRFDNNIVVTHGLAPSSKIVTLGQSQLHNGTQVQISKSPSSPITKTAQHK